MNGPPSTSIELPGIDFSGYDYNVVCPPFEWSEQLVLQDDFVHISRDASEECRTPLDYNDSSWMEGLAYETNIPYPTPSSAALAPTPTAFPSDDYDILDDMSTTFEPVSTSAAQLPQSNDKIDDGPLHQWQIITPRAKGVHHLSSNMQTAQMQYRLADLEGDIESFAMTSTAYKKYRFSCQYHTGRGKPCNQRFERKEHLLRHWNANIHCDVKSRPKAFCSLPPCVEENGGKPKGFTRIDNFIDHVLTHLHVVKEDKRSLERQRFFFQQEIQPGTHPEVQSEASTSALPDVNQGGKTMTFHRRDNAVDHQTYCTSNGKKKAAEKRSPFFEPDIIFAAIWDSEPERAGSVIIAIVHGTLQAKWRPAAVEAWLVKHRYMTRPMRETARVSILAKL